MTPGQPLSAAMRSCEAEARRPCPQALSLVHDDDVLDGTLMAFRRYGYLESRITRELRGLGLWVDSSDLAIEQTVDYVFASKISAKV